MKLSKDTKILIVGLGLIGGSYADGLTKNGFSVSAIDTSQESLDFALNQGMIKEGQTEPTAAFVGTFDVVIFALYPHAFIDWIKKYQNFFKPGAIITDVTGVKRSIVYEIQKLLRVDVEFIAAHPMAGKEKSGVKYANGDIFKGANYIYTPTMRNTEEACELAQSIGEVLGFRKISSLSPELHDEMIGFLSQLTHCIAVSLMTCKENEHLVDYTGDSFRDLTRIAYLNENMWTELFLSNKTELLKQMELFMERFGELYDFIRKEDTESMKRMMRLSSARRMLFNK